jgi:hypothetical protein
MKELLMTHSPYDPHEISRRAKELYEQSIRARVETAENVGKLISIDIETGDYEIGDDNDLGAPRRLHARHPGASVYTLRHTRQFKH